MDTLISGDWLSTLYLLGTVQGIFLAAVLAGKRQNVIPNRLLAAAMLVFSVDLGAAVYHATRFYETFPHLIGIDYPVTLLYGPLLYLYVRTLTEVGHPLRKRDLLHFLPFTVLLLYLVPFFLQSGAEKINAVSNPEVNRFIPGLEIITSLKLVHACIYLAATVRHVLRYRKHIKDTFSYTERVNLAWLRNLTLGIALLGIVAIALYLFGQKDRFYAPLGLDPDFLYDDLTLLGLTIYVYTIGYLGLRQPEIFNEHPRLAGKEFSPTHTLLINGDGFAVRDRSPEKGEEIPAETDDKPRYAKSGMDSETAKNHLAALLKLMETEKPYRRGDLTLQDLAERLSISSHNLTEVLNTQLGVNFYDFVNGFRVREVQERLKDPNSSHYTILAIAMDAGFQSKSSFNAVFKKHTNMTPSEYRRRQGIPA